MLRLADDRTHSRRDFLTLGSLGLGGFALSDLLRAEDALEQSGAPVVARKDVSVVFLFLHGGPPQAETFDPKMDAPAGVRSATGEIPTPIPGVTFGGTLEKLAPLADRFSVVRSFTTGDGNHDIKPIVSRFSGGANLGSMIARQIGAVGAETGLPTNVALYPRAVDEKAQPEVKNFGRFDSTGRLGQAFTPFVPGGGGTLQEDMTLRLDRTRLDDRRTLLTRLDALRRELERGADERGMSRFQEQAFDTLLGGAVEAFDLSKEDPRVVARYDTSGLIRPESISKRWNNHKNYRDHVSSLGKLMLLARRLCERGSRFVTVTTNFVWDMHADVNNATMTEGMHYCGRPFDHAVSAFIEDVEARGLRDRILLVACGEMGRTPKINKKGGRDHWGGLAPLLIYGGGLEMGRVIGRSTRDAGRPATTPVTIPNLIATVLSSILDPSELRATPGVPPDIVRAATAGVIPGLS